MPYRRLPKTDAARLKALKTLLDNNDIYTVRNNFVGWKSLNKAQSAYDRLYTACSQYRLLLVAQKRHTAKIDRLMRNASMYVSHFLQVLFLAVERKEIKKHNLELYGLTPETTALPNIKSPEGLLEWAPKVIHGEKMRLKKGGRPIYNPTIGMVSTHYEIFREMYAKQRASVMKTQKALEDVQSQREEIDALLLDIWNQIERHYENEPPERRYAECRKLGVVYYYRRNEKHLY